jgi:hypothetical protein
MSARATQISKGSAHPSNLERVMGIEPTSSAWKAEVLPLNYTRLVELPPYIRSNAPVKLSLRAEPKPAPALFSGVQKS